MYQKLSTKKRDDARNRSVANRQRTQDDGKSRAVANRQRTQSQYSGSMHPEAIIQRASLDPDSLTQQDIMQLQRTIGNQAVVRLFSGGEKGQKTETGTKGSKSLLEIAQRKVQASINSMRDQATAAKQKSSNTSPRMVAQRKQNENRFGKSSKETENKTGMPDHLKAGVEPLYIKQLQRTIGNQAVVIDLLGAYQGQKTEKGTKEDNRPDETIAQRQKQEMKNNSPMDQAHAAQQNKIFESPRMVAQRKQRENSFGQSSKETENKTGMPDHLKAGVENLSGLSMDDVRVHYNSPKPAQLLALAYTQGTDIHVGPGQERHLPHEAWHVVQQRQGRVKPTMQMSGEQINDEVGLEREAEVMGGQALQRKGGFRSRSTHPTLAAFQPVQLKNVNLYLPDDFEDLFKNGGKIYMIDASHRGDMYHIRAAWAIEPHPVLIYNYRGENDLVEYLKNTDENITVKTIEWNPATVHENNALINREIITESEATTIIAKEERNVKKTENKMSNVPESEASQITGLILEIFGDKVADGALVMFRDSGRSGVYPELDSGKALEQLAGILRANGLTPITCGNPKNELEIKSIGPYWEKLPKYPNIAKRDVEAYFLKKAYEQKYYKIAVGFRSGALDLFTFMNIPTISISLNELVGEDRHDKLSSWKTRTNIKYEEPRHSETTRSAAKRASVDHPYMSSGKTEEDPGALKALDESILKKGVRIAVAKLREENPYPDYKGGTVSRETMRGLIPKEYKQIGKTVDEEALIRTKLLEHLTTEKDQELGVNAVANLKTTWDEKIHDVMDKRGTAFQQTVYGKIGKIKKKTDKKEELISLLEALLGKEKDSDKDHEKYPDLLEIKKKIEEMLAVAKRALHGLNVAR